MVTMMDHDLADGEDDRHENTFEKILPFLVVLAVVVPCSHTLYGPSVWEAGRGCCEDGTLLVSILVPLAPIQIPYSGTLVNLVTPFTEAPTPRAVCLPPEVHHQTLPDYQYSLIVH